MTKLITALDVNDITEALSFAGSVKMGTWIKLGSILFTRDGPELIKLLVQKYSHKVMLDLKYHDIPNTVEKACKNAADMGVDMLTIHLGGGRKMIDAALNGVAGTNTKILGISVLTSLGEDDLRELGYKHYDMPSWLVDKLVNIGVGCGIHGIVCSAHETKSLRDQHDEDLIIVNPGIRLASGDIQDQKRVATPKFAAEQGASFIVMGRPIYQADNPMEVCSNVEGELNV